ncbi:MAG: nitrophenyl compound nitroreductase subunit ArsF family protein [Prevotella copri]|nr:nitrophenyl compound nitroreductase subunit ArsF family protein [Segatella copri]MDY6204656.1 nitrophenyl compound nitroreductase subunit ArsF family protein [Segatella copri]
MKKITIMLLATLLSTTTISACTGNSTPESKKETVAKQKAAVEIIYFHGKQRCKTCIAIEKETKALVEGELAELLKKGKVKFRIVDFSTDEGKKIASKYKVTFSSLFVVTPKGAEDLTRFAFANARSNAEGFRKELKDKVVKTIK